VKIDADSQNLMSLCGVHRSRMDEILHRALAVIRLRLRLRILLLPLLALLSLPLLACSEEKVGIDLVGYNHTDYEIGHFSVDGSGGTYLGEHEGGGKFVCCVSVPRKYKPGMKVHVSWGGVGVKTQERVVDVPPYKPEDTGVFAVHFLRNGEVKVFVTSYALGHPNYPLKGDEAKM